jgi:hypothetical protein
MRICLEEIARCQRVTPKPNFIVAHQNRSTPCRPGVSCERWSMRPRRRGEVRSCPDAMMDFPTPTGLL